jgi:hypothetical protein
MQLVSNFISDFQGSSEFDTIQAVFYTFPTGSVISVDDHSEEDYLLNQSLSMLDYESPLPHSTGFTYEWSVKGNVCRVTWPIDPGCSAPCAYVICGDLLAQV